MLSLIWIKTIYDILISDLSLKWVFEKIFNNYENKIRRRPKSMIIQPLMRSVLGDGGGGGGGGGLGWGGNLGVILVWVCQPFFLNLLQLYTWSSKKMTYSYT